jgi:4-amino-4-deoxy-L-arabinose transferase-like glycosyltransferase
VRISRASADWLLLAGFCGFLFFFGLAFLGLIGADEPRYAQVAREMLARHDWITPTLGGKPWLEKPPLYYWQAMLAYSIFGVSDWAARLPSAVDATLVVVVTYLFLRRFRPGFQLDGALMTASAAGIIAFARAASTDMPLAATFTIALLAWFAWYESQSRRFLAFFYCFLALGMLAKGPVAPLLAAVIIVIFAAVTSDYRVLRRTLWVPGILLFCAVVLPWHLAVQIKNPEFFRVFILQHNLARFGTNLYHHSEPFWYYVPITLLGLIPWTVFVVASLAETVRVWWTARREILDSERALDVFLVIWVAAPVAFFSLSQSKLPGYIVPALPAGTLLLAEYVRRRVAEGKSPSIFFIVLHAITAAVPIVPALMIQYLVLQHRLPWGKVGGIRFALAAGLAIGIAITLRTRLGLGALRFVTLVPVLLSIWVLLGSAPALDSMLSVRPLANEISHLETKPLPLAVAGVSRETQFGLTFYRNQIIDRYESGEVPADEHLVVAPEGSQTAIAKQVAGRRVSYLGSFAPQGLDYYWVSAEGMREMSH